MKRLHLTILALLVMAIVATLVQGARPDRIKDHHATHAKNDVACETCHTVAQSTSGADNLLPTMDTCKSCHDIEDATRCGVCHTNPQAPAAAPRVTEVARKFPHEKHLAGGMACADCHGDAKAGAALPKMTVCRTCHETTPAQADCRLCHDAKEPLRPESHVVDWVSLHGPDARTNPADCQSCHTQTDCQSCHVGDNVRPRTHRLNFLFDHALEARGQELDCAACHEDRAFCADCHRANHVMPQDHSRADWLGGTLGGRHAEEGRVDLEGCVACHDTGNQAPLCADCHGR